jgi:hypothetical protein
VVTKEQFSTFVERATQEKEGLQLGVVPSRLKIHVEDLPIEGSETNELHRTVTVALDGQRLVATPRAKENLLRLTGFTGKLFESLTHEQLNEGLNFQVGKIASLGVVKVADRMATVFDNTKFGYTSYLDVLNGVDQNKLVYIKGTPVEDDFVRILVKERQVDFDDKLIVGLESSMGSTPNVKSRFAFGTFRLICSNGAVMPMYKQNTAAFVDNGLFVGMLNAYRAELDPFIEKLEGFVRFAKGFEISTPEYANELIKHLSAPKKIRELLSSCVNAPDQNAAMMHQAGVDTPGNLWGMFNILTYLASHAPNVKSGLSLEKNAFSWATRIASINLN